MCLLVKGFARADNDAPADCTQWPEKPSWYRVQRYHVQSVGEDCAEEDLWANIRAAGDVAVAGFWRGLFDGWEDAPSHNLDC